MIRPLRFVLRNTDKACQLLLALYVLYFVYRHVKIAALLGAVSLIVQKTNPEAYQKFKDMLSNPKKSSCYLTIKKGG